MRSGIYARNYDFHPLYFDGRLAMVNPVGALASVGFSEFEVGRLDGMNEKGLVAGLHFVAREKNREGLFCGTITRIVLDRCATVREAVDLLRELPHAQSYNYSLMDRSGMSAVVEASPKAVAVRLGDERACANRFEKLATPKAYGDRFDSDTRTAELLRIATDSITIEAAYHALNSTGTPLFRVDYKKWFGTLYTVIYQPQTLSILIGIGSTNEPVEIDVGHWFSGGDCTVPGLSGVLTGNVPPLRGKKTGNAAD
jgi:predicted choloylglycine hydrolase